MVTVSPLALHTPTRVKWTALQEKSISREYPFTDLADESPDQFVVRTYLQFLWLPESIMPLTLLIPSIRRVSSSRHPSELEHENTHAHALHTLIQPLLLSVRTSASKYHTELPQILADNGGAGELEETMMWFALNYEKSSEDEDEERWRNQWLERLERREVQIQILLYFLKLSLPGPQTPLPPVTIPAPATTTSFPTSTSTHSRKRKSKPKIVIPSTTERLESFMDKLSTWQLLSSMDAGAPTSPGNRSGDRELERDWMQAFCEDVVEPQ
ncbi:hypothetical protein BV22DRAFT_1018890 [Leucogyrophana mollusca]|uniref:Uncharacterized protein n=1 Tax=Leucogyrophana mollusca TaxID=85980 RepID=A0ACB8B884_9AGAM|nr:hypothetical protein BV22DRAFT_1018890 [Leucogyrophana mollusca]